MEMDLSQLSNDELKNYLKQQSQRLTQVAESETERAQLRERVELLTSQIEEIEAQFGAASTPRLLAESQRLTQVLHAERERAEAKLALINDRDAAPESEATPALPRGESAPSEEAQAQVADAPDAQPDALLVDDHDLAEETLTEDEVEVDPTPETDALEIDQENERSLSSREELAAHFEVIRDAADELSNDIRLMDMPDLLKLHLERLAINIGQVKVLPRYDEFVDEALEDEVRRIYGRLTRLAMECCNPANLRVSWLKREENEGFDGDWDEQEAWVIRRITTFEDRLTREEEERELKQREKAKREIEQAREAIQFFNQMRKEPDAASAERARWQTLTIQAAERLAESYNNDSIPEPILKRLKPLEDMLAGSVFRSLRRKLGKLDANDEVNAREENAFIQQMEARAEPAKKAPVAKGPFESAFKGKRMVIIGGNKRLDRLEAIRNYFGFDAGDWVEHESGNLLRGVQSAATKIQSGYYDVVFFLAAFCSHSAQTLIKQGFRAREMEGGDFVVVPRGYGINALIKGLELTRTGRSN